MAGRDVQDPGAWRLGPGHDSGPVRQTGPTAERAVEVVLAEKPSVAREIAGFLGAGAREGFLEGNGYQVTWAFGHLVALKEPDEYDPALKRWSLEPLPFIPERFELKLVPEPHARQQFAVVKRLFQAATAIICATDAGARGN